MCTQVDEAALRGQSEQGLEMLHYGSTIKACSSCGMAATPQELNQEGKCPRMHDLDRGGVALRATLTA